MPASIASYSVKEEITNALSHAFGAILSCIALYLLLNQPATPLTANNETIQLISYSIYGTSLLLLFLASTVYHALVNEEAKRLFKLLDHCAIYLLIAGTYTPLLLITLAGPLGYSLIALIWTIAIAGISFKIKFGSRFKKTSLATYLGMGFISFAIIGELYQALPVEAVALLALGGLIYCLGVIFYVKKHIAYTHAVWHFFVLGGAICHFLMIYWYV